MVPARHNQNWIPDIFNDFFDNTWMERPKATAPAINVLETPDAYQLELAAPGMTKADFDIHLDEEGDLVINMEKKSSENEKPQGPLSPPRVLLHQVPADDASSGRHRPRSHRRQSRERRPHREPTQDQED